MTGPLLLGYIDFDSDVKQEKKGTGSWKSLPKHRDEDQVRLDVDRSFIYYPNGGSWLLYGHILHGADTFAQTNPLKTLIDEKKSFPT
jgi:hypothetical protein